MIRQFRTDDAQACGAIIHDYIGRDPQLSDALRERLRRAESAETMIQRAHLFYVSVYESNGSIVGVGGLELNEVRLLCVSAENQDKGIGKALLEHLEFMVPSELFSDIFVYSTFAAVNFYRAQGFTPRGEFVFDMCGEPLTTVFMTKATR